MNTSAKVQNILQLIATATAKQQFINRWNVFKNTGNADVFLDSVTNRLRNNPLLKTTETLPDGVELFTASNGKQYKLRLQLGVYAKKWQEAGKRLNALPTAVEPDVFPGYELPGDDFTRIADYKTDSLRCCSKCGCQDYYGICPRCYFEFGDFFTTQ